MEYMVTRRCDMSEDELMHSGVKGMKWGIRRAAQAVNNHGKQTLSKKQDLYTMKSNRSKRDGNKIRSAYYKRKSYKMQDKQYSDVATFIEGMRDISIKAGVVMSLANTGKNVASTWFTDYKTHKHNMNRSM